MRDRTGLGFTAAAVFLSLSAFAGADGSPRRFQVLATLPSDGKVREITFSADYRHCAYLLLRPNADKRAVVDGKPGARFDFISGVIFSPDGRRWAHTGIHGSKEYMVVDGREQGPFDRVGTEPHFSPDGRHVIYYAKQGPEQFIVTDGNRGPSFDEIHGSLDQADFSLSADGGRYAYTARKGKSWFTVIDGVPGEPYDEVSQYTGFSADGRHAVSLGRRGAKRWLILDGRARETAAYDAAQMPAVSRDGTHAAFFARRNGRNFIVADGKESSVPGGPYAIQFAPDDQRLIYLCTDGHSRWVVDGGRAGRHYGGVGYPVVGPRGWALAYGAADGRHSFPVVNDRRGADFDLGRIGPLTFSPDGAHVAFIAQRYARWILAVDDREFSLPGPPQGLSFKPLFSFDAKGDEIALGLRLGRDVVRAAFPVAGP